MKKVVLTLIVAIFYMQIAKTQITIDSTDVASIGTNVIMISDTVVSGLMIGNPSPNAQSWNFATLNVDKVDTLKFTAPVNSPDPGSFPGANLVMQQENNFVYLNKSVSSFAINGLYGDIFGQGVITPVKLSPPLKQIEFPSTYGSTFAMTSTLDTVVEDLFTGGLFDSLRLKRIMTINSNVDAWGELILPTGTDSVIRKYDVETSVDSIWGLVLNNWVAITNINTTTHYYRYLAKNRDFYLLEAQASAPNGTLTSAFYQVGSTLFANVINSNEPSCKGSADGLIAISTLGGVPPYSYNWNNGQSNSTATGLAAGAYTCTVTDASSDNVVVSFVLGEPDTISIASTQIGPDNGAQEGFIFISATGGTANIGYSYLWSNGETTQNIQNLAFGDYTVTVTDDNSCTNSATFTVDNNTGILPISASANLRVFPNPAQDYLMIDLEQNTPVAIQIYDLKGRTVHVTKVNSDSKIDLSQLPAGHYILLINMDGQSYSSPIEIVR